MGAKDNPDMPESQKIDIVGYSCRLPGAGSVSAFWDVLREGRFTVSEIPPDRWSAQRFKHPRFGEKGKSYSFAAGVVDNVFDFDPEVFGISPREAEQMDPQQRLLLEVVREALEAAALAPIQLAGSNTGVFVGTSGLDYSNRYMQDMAVADGYFMTGNTLSIISNRISHVFDLHGPSFTVDTACSSSLVAMHQAVRALEAGECDIAIVGGVNLLLTPYPFVGFSAATMLSPMGQCRAFDTAAEGYVRAEGAAAFVLCRAGKTAEYHLCPQARIAGSGINSDGRTPGISLPSAEYQTRLLQQVYDETGIQPDELAFIEAHGTGTRVGDPAEAQSLGTVLGQKRRRRLPIGSVKTNIGHLEPASGLAGVLKACLALKHDLLPASLHFENPNPDIDFEALNLQVAGEATALAPRKAGPRYAGINSFGFGGTNAHVIIADPDLPPAPAPAYRKGQGGVLLLSARTEAALSDMAANYAAGLGEDRFGAGNPDELAAQILTQSDPMEQGLAVLGESTAEWQAGLEDFLAGRKAPQVIAGARGAFEMPVLFAYSGNGAQWAGMGRIAYHRNAAFRQRFDEISAQFEVLAGWSLIEALNDDEMDEKMASAVFVQPMLFACQAALTAGLKALGLHPAAVMGHSVGEVAAAEACGALSLEDALNVIHKRSVHQEIARGTGTMAAILLSAEETRAAIDESGFDAVEIAAVNSPRSVTISGPEEQVQGFVRHARKKRIAGRLIKLDYPFHSALIEAVRDPLLADLTGLTPRDGDIAFISSVTGTVMPGSRLDGQYWWSNVRQPVRFADAVFAAAQQEAMLYLEIGPRPVLTTYIKDTLGAGGHHGPVLKSLDASDSPDIDPVLASAARTLVHGGRMELAAVFGSDPGRNGGLPHYPWQRKTFRLPHTMESASPLSPDDGGHPLLGWRDIADSKAWHVHIDAVNVPWLADHKVNGRTVVPGTALAEMALAAASQWQGSAAVELRDMDIVQALILEEGRLREVRTSLSADTSSFEISSRARLSSEDWQVHASGRFAVLPPADGAPTPAARLDPDDNAPVLAPIYELARRYGLEYGPAFRKLCAVERPGKDRLSIALCPPEAGGLAHAARYQVFPDEFDACFHGLAALFEDLSAGGDRLAYVPVRFGRLRLYQAGRHIRCGEIRIRSATQRGIAADFTLMDADGAVVLTLKDARFRAASLVRRPSLEHLAYHTAFAPMALPGAEADPVQLPEITLPQPMADGDDAELLLEAAARRAAFDALSAGGEAASDFSALAQALWQHLEESGLAEQSGEGWQAAETSGLPDVDTLLRTIIADYPAASAGAVLLARAHRVLPACLAGGGLPEGPLYGPATLDHYLSSAPHRRRGVDLIAGYVRRMAAEWPLKRPLRIAELGAGSGQLSLVLNGLARQGRITHCLADTDKGRLERVQALTGSAMGSEFADLSERLDALAEAGPFDLAVAAGTLHQLSGPGRLLKKLGSVMAPGGQVVMVEEEPDIYSDLVFGLIPDWFQRSVHAEFPLGARRFAEEWRSELIGAGFKDAEHAQGGRTVLLRAQGGRAAPDAVAEESRLLMICGSNEDVQFADHLTAALALAGRSVSLIAPGTACNGGDHFTPLDADCWRQVLAGDDAERPAEIIYLSGAFDGGAPEALGTRICGMSAMLQSLGDRPARLWVIAPGGARAAAGLGGEDPVQSGVWGFTRVAANEYSDCDFRLIDFDAALTGDEAATRLAAAINAPGEETELILSAGHAAAVRAERGPVAMAGEQGAEAAMLDFQRAGSLDNLHWRACPRRKPGPGQVEIEVAAASLNFRDVMWTLGMLPEEALEEGFAGPALGLECSGRISAVGEGVEAFAVGDGVIAFASACFSTHVIVDDIAVAALPETIDPIGGATIPVAFFTAYYALHHLGRLGNGEWLLIHGGAGGVGLAAIQIAKWRGARIIATAGSGEKRDFLTALGVDHVLDSRSLSFADQVMELTGDGVDVVLNSLSGEAMERSFELVRPFGRFLELGKRDFYANTKLGLRPFRRNVSYFGIDADQLLSMQAELGKALFREMVRHFGDGSFTPLPHRVFRAEQSIDAFRLMQQSGHVGKIVITPPAPGEIAAKKRRDGFAADAEGAHLIIGGLGGFGFETACWLAERGARHIVLTSRSGTVSEEMQARIAGLEAQGVRVTAAASDVTDADSLAALLSDIRAVRPLKGAVHAAMVLDDALIGNLTPEKIGRVLAAKVEGAANLDRLTAEDALDYFILFSSATTLVGNPGQAHYVAANAYLEGLARQRRLAGRPGLAVGWGAITDAGYLTRNKEVGEQLSQRTGFDEFRAASALGLLEQVLEGEGREVVGAALAIAPIDWGQARRDLTLLGKPLFRHLASQIGEERGEGEGVLDLAALVAGLDAAGARQAVSGLLAKEVGRILRIPAEGINLQRPLTDIGMDSLMGLELRGAAQDKFGIDISLVSMSDGTSLNDITDKILKRIGGGETEPAERIGEDLIAQHLSSGDGEGGARPGGTLITRSGEAGDGAS